jgi:hypothetical protein
MNTNMLLCMTPAVQRAMQAETQQDRSGALELERDALRQHTADLSDKLSKLQTDFNNAKIAMDNMVPR